MVAKHLFLIIFFSLTLFQFGSWTHSGQAMVLSAQSESANLGQYIENEQWTLDGAVMREEKHFYACCPGVPFYDIVLTITITRKPMFALFYYVWPSLLLLLIGKHTFGILKIRNRHFFCHITTGS